MTAILHDLSLKCIRTNVRELIKSYVTRTTRSLILKFSYNCDFVSREDRSKPRKVFKHVPKSRLPWPQSRRRIRVFLVVQFSIFEQYATFWKDKYFNFLMLKLIKQNYSSVLSSMFCSMQILGGRLVTYPLSFSCLKARWASKLTHTCTHMLVARASSLSSKTQEN